MIQSNELRIGNYVNLNDGSEHDKIRQISGIEHKIVYTLIKGCRFAQVYQSFDRIYPIPLTEEILLKCGFTKVPLESNNPEEGYYYSLRLSDYKYCDLSLLSGDNNGIFEVYLFPYDNIRLQYLHQVQNIYQSITGKELEVNL